MKITARKQRSRRGIVLISVLALLAMLVILAVAFAITMQTDRVAGKYSEDSIRAEQLALMGLTRAVDAIDANVGAMPAPAWQFLKSGSYTTPPTTQPADATPVITAGIAPDYLAAIACNYLPIYFPPTSVASASGSGSNVLTAGMTWSTKILTNGVVVNLADRSHAIIISNASNKIYGQLVGGFQNTWLQNDQCFVVTNSPVNLADHSRPGWVNMVVNNKAIGRYAFFVCDCSGLLDVHNVGLANRTNSYAPQAVDVSQLIELAAASTRLRLGTVQTNRTDDNWSRYESLWDFFALNAYFPSSPTRTYAQFSTNLFTYSYFPSGVERSGTRTLNYNYSRLNGFADAANSTVPMGWWDRVNNNKELLCVDISGSNAVKIAQCRIDTRTNLFMVLTNYWNPGDLALNNAVNYAYTNLMDFISASDQPTAKTFGPCGKAIPLINEVVCSNMTFTTVQVLSNAAGYTTNYWISTTNKVAIEFWYPFQPFVQKNVTLTGSGTFSAGGTPLNPQPPPAFAINATVNMTTPLVVYYHPTAVFKASTKVASLPSNMVTKLSLSLSTANAGGSTWTRGFSCPFAISLTNRSVVPGLPNPITAFPYTKTTSTVAVCQFEALDPRWNWCPTNGDLWIYSPTNAFISLGKTNYFTAWGTNAFYKAGTGRPLAPAKNDPGPDGAWDATNSMYVANAPLNTVGELGYINYAPWRSLRLQKFVGEASVFDLFCVRYPNAQGTNFSVRAVTPSGTASPLEILNGYGIGQETNLTMAVTSSGSGTITLDQALLPASAAGKNNAIRISCYVKVTANSTKFTASGTIKNSTLCVNGRRLVDGSGGFNAITWPADGGTQWATVEYTAQIVGQQTLTFQIQNAGTPIATAPVSGFVNPNSRKLEVLKAAFVNAPQREHVAASSQIALATATPYANAIVGQTITMPSDLAKLAALFATGASKAEKEAPLRNSLQVFNPRQQFYTIVFAAQSGMDYNKDKLITDDEVLSQKIGVAVLWRDPVPDSTGIHHSFIRFFKWLDE